MKLQSCRAMYWRFAVWSAAVQVTEAVQGTSAATNSIPHSLLAKLVSTPAVLASLRSHISGTRCPGEHTGEYACLCWGRGGGAIKTMRHNGFKSDGGVFSCFLFGIGLLLPCRCISSSKFSH